MNFEEDEMKDGEEEAEFDGSSIEEADDELFDEDDAEIDTPPGDEFTEGDPDEEEGLGSDDSF